MAVGKCAGWLIGVCGLLLAFAGACQKLSAQAPQQTNVSPWIMQQPEDWRWNARIGHVRFYPQLTEYPQWEQITETHLKALHSYGINVVALMGYHFRFNYIEQWASLETQIETICRIAHGLGMKVLAHHSAACITDNNLGLKVGVGEHTLGDITPVELTTGKADISNSGVPGQGRIFFCPNNPLHFQVYSRHIRGLIEAGIDGLMSDDVEYLYNHYSCTCSHCREKFISEGGFPLPPPDEANFWMNFENPRFRQWSAFRNRSTASHYRRLVELFAEYSDRKLELLACNSQPAGTLLNVHWCVNLEEMIRAGLTINYFEPMASTAYDYFTDWYHHAIDLKLMRASGASRVTGRPGDIPIYSGWYPGATNRYQDYFDSEEMATSFRRGRPLGSDYYPERPEPTREQLNQDVFIYGLNHAFGDRLWLCWDYHHYKHLLAFDVKYPGLFRRGGSLAKVALMFSGQTRNVYKPVSDEAYVDAWRGWVTTLLDENIWFDLLVDSDLARGVPSQYEVLVLANMACMSEQQCQSVRQFVDRGGKLVATHETSLYDETGYARNDFGLADLFGVSSEGTAQQASGRFDQAKVGLDPTTSKFMAVLRESQPGGVLAPVRLAASFDHGPQSYLGMTTDPGQERPAIVMRPNDHHGAVLYCALKVGNLGLVRRPQDLSHKVRGKWLGPSDGQYKEFMKASIDWGLGNRRQLAFDPPVKGLICEAYQGDRQALVFHILNAGGVDRPTGQEYVYPLTTYFPKLPAETITMILTDVPATGAILFSPDLADPQRLEIDVRDGKTSINIPSAGIERYGIIVVEQIWGQSAISH